MKETDNETSTSSKRPSLKRTSVKKIKTARELTPAKEGHTQCIISVN